MLAENGPANVVRLLINFPDLQPTLTGSLLHLRPLKNDDFEELFTAASDPLIWELHPQSNRYQREIFLKYFEGAMESNGGFAIEDKASGKVIGSSRYYGYNPDLKQIFIGYTFLTRAYWGGKFNRELKTLMMDHAFHFAESILFEVGEKNLRSRRAMEKIGGRLFSSALLDEKPHVVFRIDKPILK